MGTTEYSITDDFTNLGVGERPQAAQLHNEILASSAFSDPVNDFMGVNVAVNDQGEIDADAVTVHWSVAPSNLAALNAVIAAHPDTGVTPEPAAGDFVPGLQARRSTEFTATLNTFVDIPFDLTDFENDPESLEHDNTNTERLLIKETGDYEVGYFGDVDAGQDSVLQMRIRKNGTETLNGTLAEVAEGEGDSDTCTYTTGRKTLVSLDAVIISRSRFAENQVKIVISIISLPSLSQCREKKEIKDRQVLVRASLSKMRPWPFQVVLSLRLISMDRTFLLQTVEEAVRSSLSPLRHLFMVLSHKT